MTIQNKNIIYYVFIVLIAVLAFWEISTNYKTLKFDMIDGNYPFQSLQSHYELQGKIPLWDPYTLMGNAMHAKMSQWYPLRFISAKISEYTLQKLNFDFILHIILAGIGMFVLLRRLKIFNSIACALGCAYMLSGFFVGNAQHMAWIISGALLPWIIITYCDFLEKLNFKSLIYFVFVFFSFIVGGYPAFTVVLIYLGIFYILFYCILHWKSNEFNFKKIVKYHVIAGLLLLILLAIPIVSHHTMMSMITRGNGVTLVAALHDSIHFKHFFTCIFPFISTAKVFNWGADQSMINMYVGSIVLAGLLLSLRNIKQKKILILWVLTVFFILVSMGDQFPIRTFLYTYIPLWDTFRFPALFRLFYIFTGIILAAYSFQELHTRIITKHIIILYGVILIISTALSVYFVSQWNFMEFQQLINWHGFVASITKIQAISVQFIIIAVISFVILFVVVKLSPRYIGSNSIRIIAMCIIVEMLISTLAQSALTVSSDSNPKLVQSKVDSIGKKTFGVDIMNPAKSMYEYGIIAPLWRNNQVFYKKRAFDGYTSYVYKTTEEFEKSVMYDSVKKYPLAYFPTVIYPYSREDYNYTHGKIAAISTQNDDLLYQKGVKVLLQSTSGNTFTFVTNTIKPSYLVFMQNWYPGWKVFIQGKETKIEQANYSCMAVKVPQGTNIVKFEYKPTYVVIAYYIYELALYMLICAMIWISIPSKYKNFRMYITIGTIAIFIIIELKNHLIV